MAVTWSFKRSGLNGSQHNLTHHVLCPCPWLGEMTRTMSETKIPRHRCFLISGFQSMGRLKCVSLSRWINYFIFKCMLILTSSWKVGVCLTSEPSACWLWCSITKHQRINAGYTNVKVTKAMRFRVGKISLGGTDVREHFLQSVVTELSFKHYTCVRPLLAKLHGGGVSMLIANLKGFLTRHFIAH